MTERKKIVILGGSYGGISTTHYLLRKVIKQLPDRASYQVVLISASPEVMCRPACPRALISDDMFPQDKLFVDIGKSFHQYPADSLLFLHGKAVSLNHVKRVVTVELPDGSSEEINFFALVVATGSSTVSPLLGLSIDARHLRAQWAQFRGALSSAKSIVVAGGGPAGIETAGELGEFLNGKTGYFSQRLKEPRVSITVLCRGSQTLPHLRPSLATKAEKQLAKVGVTVVKNATVVSVDPPEAGTGNVASKASITLEDGTIHHADLYIPATGTKPNTAFVDGSLRASDGRTETNLSTLRIDKAGPRIYAVGDVSNSARPAIHLLMEAVPVLCANIKKDLLPDASKADVVYKEDVRETQIVPIGKTQGLGAAMGYQLPGFIMRFLKGKDYWLWTTEKLWNGNQWK